VPLLLLLPLLLLPLPLLLLPLPQLLQLLLLLPLLLHCCQHPILPLLWRWLLELWLAAATQQA
jgi:hypothetical protein